MILKFGKSWMVLVGLMAGVVELIGADRTVEVDKMVGLDKMVGVDKLVGLDRMVGMVEVDRFEQIELGEWEDLWWFG